MSHLVGQRVPCDWEPDGTLHTHQVWRFQCPLGTVIANYQCNDIAAAVVPLDAGSTGNTNGGALNTYWTAAGDYFYTTTLTYNTRTVPGQQATRGTPPNIAFLEIIAPAVVPLVVTPAGPLPGGARTNPFRLYSAGTSNAYIEMGDATSANPLQQSGFMIVLEAIVDPTHPDATTGEFCYVQLGTCDLDYTTRDGRHLRANNLAMPMQLDQHFPYEGSETHPVGPATWNVSMDDSPSCPLPARGFSAASATYLFTTYLMYKPTADAIWVALGHMDWAASFAAAKASDATPWVIAAQAQNHGVWTAGNHMPQWAGNLRGVITQMAVMLNVEGTSKGIFIPPLLVALAHLADYRMYQAKTRSGVIPQEFKDRFEGHFQANLLPAAPNEFRAWMLPEDAARVSGFADLVDFGDVPASEKYQHAKGSYAPPFGINYTWDIAVAPLCFARVGMPDEQAYWQRFTDLNEAKIIATLQDVLPGVTVTCSGMHAAFGIFRITFSRAPSEQDILAIGAINWVSYINPYYPIPSPEPYADRVILADGMTISLGQPWYANYWLDGNTVLGSVGLAAVQDAAHSGTWWKVVAHGNDVFSFRCLGADVRPEHTWLDGNTIGGQVTLVADTGPNHSGARWKALSHGENKYTLECLGNHDNPQLRVLSSAGGSVQLRPASTITQTGTIWRVKVDSVDH